LARASGITPVAITMASDNETARFTVRLLLKETTRTKLSAWEF
jgi:hypothetical protein